jgi:hypothetical protein
MVVMVVTVPPSCLTMAKRGYADDQNHHTPTLNTAEKTRTFIDACVTVKLPGMCA